MKKQRQLRLSTRACNVLVYLVFDMDRYNYDSTGKVAEIRAMAPSSLRGRVSVGLARHFPKAETRNVYERLMFMKNCGEQTAREICAALGFAMPKQKPHNCRCWICGRTLDKNGDCDEGVPPEADDLEQYDDEPSGGPHP